VKRPNQSIIAGADIPGTVTVSFLKPPFEQENVRQENSSPHFSVRHFPVQKAQSILAV
jgi:hypothetical protein